MKLNAFNNQRFIPLILWTTVIITLPTQLMFAQQPSKPGALEKSITLEVGEQRILDAEGVRSFSEGLKGVIDVRLTRDNSQFVVVGLRPGNTTLLLIMVDGEEQYYRFSVVDPAAKPSTEPEQGVEARDNVRLDFYFVQISNSGSHNIGIRWPSAIGDTATVSARLDLQRGNLTSATAVVSSQVLPRLDLAQSEGWAKIMRKAAVITANGTEATYSGGGEINVPVSGGFGGTIKQISFGSTIGVKPIYDKKSGRIELTITADVSDLADDNGTGVPGRVVSTLQTVVNLELGQSLILAGLTAESQTKGQTGLPGLSQIPIIGLLFGTNASQTSKTENLVFIVPTVIETVASRKRELIQEALSQYESFSGDWDEVQLMPQERQGADR
ncbi:MAG: pilus assembly protein N-terminal domain-containing protein [Deltaproteobacteria bacterium]|nr:pilus assembly protein N-terminal domain-containing protein [Deltaproteobacteria bacterium]